MTALAEREPPASPLERTVGTLEEGARIDALLAEWLAVPRAAVQRRLAAGEVTVDGEAVAKSHRVREGEHVVVLPAGPPPDVAPPPRVPIRHEDDDVAVVAKPAGLVVHQGSGPPEPTLVDALRAQGVPLAAGDDPLRPGIVHRLDRGTSGLIVVAKTTAARTGLIDQLRARTVERRYWAIVEGVPDPRSATVDAPIARSGTHRTRFTVDPAGRPAVSHYDVEEAFGRAAVVSVRLETGRTHQVRVHMSAVGHPLAGDRTYGGSARLAEELRLARPALHAARLVFRHPVSGAAVTVEEPLPADLRAALAHLRGAA